MNKPKTHDNLTVNAYVSRYTNARELCEHHPQIDGLFSGVLALRTEGNSATRALSRRVLFHILQWCTVIDVPSVNEATHHQLAYSTVAAYTATARVASKALERFIQNLPEDAERITTREAQEALDAPYKAELISLSMV